MTDNDAAKRGIASLTKPGETEALMKRAFPRDTVETLERLTEVPRRSITRWAADQQRMPPTLKAKLEYQVVLKRAFLDDLADLMRQHEGAGLLPEVIRQSLLVEVNGEFFKNPQSL